jgi:hypothetical protein
MNLVDNNGIFRADQGSSAKNVRARILAAPGIQKLTTLDAPLAVFSFASASARIE